MTIAPLPPPPPPPATLDEFLDQYLPKRVSGRAVPDRAARFTAEWVTATDAGTEPPSMEGLDGDSLWMVSELLDVLLQHNRYWTPVTPLLFQLKREYGERVEIIPAPPGGPGQLLRQPPTARVKPRPGPVFRPSPNQMSLPRAVVARQLHELAESGEAAARFLRVLAAAVGDRSGIGQDAGADTTSLDDAGRDAVGALLEAGARAMRARGKGDLAAGLSQVFAEWQVWARTPQARGATKAAEPAAAMTGSA